MTTITDRKLGKPLMRFVHQLHACWPGVIGMGQMARAMVECICSRGGVQKKDILVTCKTQQTADTLRSEGYTLAASNEEVVKSCDMVIVGVKPYQLFDALGKSLVTYPTAICIYLCAGIPMHTVQEKCGDAKIKIVRAMPNMCCAVGQSCTLCTFSEAMDPKDISFCEQLLGLCGSVVKIEERLYDIATTLAGSSPAFFHLVAEIMIEAGIEHGLSRKCATDLVGQSMRGAGTTITELKLDPVTLKQQIQSPNGCTIAALNDMEKQGIRKSILSGIKTCVEKLAKMARG